ncbi:MAG: tetratricopeptide repeat protein [Alphaproteobacteria bacterium]
MTDLLREIDEELERERMLVLWNKYNKPIIIAIAALLIGTASYSAWNGHRLQGDVSRSVGLNAIISRIDQKDEEKAEAFAAYAGEFPGTGHAVLAKIAAARAYLDAGQAPKALTILDGLTREEGAPEYIRQYAALLWVEAQLDTGDAVALRQKLTPLIADQQPWRFTARTLLGLLYGKNGDNAKAREIFQALEAEAEIPDGLREEAHDLARYYATQG